MKVVLKRSLEAHLKITSNELNAGSTFVLCLRFSAAHVGHCRLLFIVRTKKTLNFDSIRL